MIQVQINQPVSIQDMAADLKAMQSWHDEMYAIKHQGRIVRILECGNCDTCKAMASLRTAIKQVSRSVAA